MLNTYDKRTPMPERDPETSSYPQPLGGAGEGAPHLPNAKLPHERDETARPAADRTDQNTPSSDQKIAQAGKDIENGLVDTDRRGIPDDVPGAQ